MPWENHARCRDIDPELFFSPRPTSERRAKAVCARCSVKGNCLSFAIRMRVEFGVYGGTTGRERRAMMGSPGLDEALPAGISGLHP
jgi:WhiB family redox-sensing transcriptional regulator